MKEPLVTVSITTWNRERFLPAAIRSVLDQIYKAWELIIVDNGSGNGTEKMVREFMRRDQRIRFFRFERNKGLAAGRNKAIREARGKYFTFLDDDDAWNEGFLTEFVNLAEAYDDNWCFCCGGLMDIRGQKMEIIPKMSGTLKDYIARGYTPPVAGQFYFVSQLRKVGGYDEKVKSGVDHDLWLRLACAGLHIKSLGKALAVPNPAGGDDRMTTRMRDRIKKIGEALEIWEEPIKNCFGGNFYQHFRKSHFYYLYRGIVIRAVMDKKWSTALKFFLKSPFRFRLLLELIRGFWRKMKRHGDIVREEQGPLFVPFRGSLNVKSDSSSAKNT